MFLGIRAYQLLYCLSCFLGICFFFLFPSHPNPPARVRNDRSDRSLHCVKGASGWVRGGPPTGFRRGAGGGGGGPSIASSPCAGKSRRLAASARMAAMDASAAQRSAQAAAAVDRAQVGSVRARARARCRTRCTASGDHRPPTSNPNTARRQRVLDWNSG